MIPAFGYLRVSGLTQATDEAGGLPRQKTNIETFAEKNGYSVERIFSEALTGKTEFSHRPAFREMLSELGQVKVVIIEKLDRLARDLLVQETIIADLKKRGFTLVSTMEPDLCSDDPTRILIRQILGAVAQFDRAMICMRLKAGADRARSAGRKWGGRHRYGKTEQEQSIVAKIHALDVQGLTLTAIAETLNREGIRSRTGKLFYPMSISRVLKGEKPCQK